MDSLRTANRQDGESAIASRFIFSFLSFLSIFFPDPALCARPSLSTRISWSWPTLPCTHHITSICFANMVGTVGWYLCVCYLLWLLVSLIILSRCSWPCDPL
ncbi:hypothetical protein F4680DRAFT_407947 [Xylaria scruposa]|nr:hypothetical protein F4680DRAFT_407947 [Xylaria scruposa]